MLRQIAIAASIVITAASILLAAERSSTPPIGSAAAPQKLLIPGTNYEVTLSSVRFSPKENHSGKALLTALTVWVSETSGLAASYDLPDVKFASARELIRLRYQELLDAGLVGGSVTTNTRESVAIYNDQTRTIYLQEGWNGSTPTELSILVHELVHHLQNSGKVKYECPQQRELLAYRVQDQWLALFGRDLSQDFEIDPFTLLVITTCGY